MSFRDLVREIHHRSIWQVLGIYVVASIGALEVVDMLVDSTALPEWFPTFAIALVILGLPVVLASAVVHEEAPLPSSESKQKARTAQDAAEADARSEGEAPGAGTPHATAAPVRTRRVLTWQRALAGVVVLFAVWGLVAAGWLLLVGPGALVGGPAGEASAGAAARGSAEDPGRISVATDPPGALVRVLPVHPVEDLPRRDATSLGETPVTSHELPPNQYLVMLEAEGTAPLRLLATIRSGETTNVMQALVTEAEEEGMLLVEAGSHGAGEQGGGPVPAFLMDRHEVTNAEYLEFVTAGGYEDPSLWPRSMLVGGDSLPGEQALASFVDRTGSSGPRGWSGGLYPEGKGSHPVVGVSWYEARAYARWAGRELPSWDQWWRAAVSEDGRIYPWGSEIETLEVRANFENEGSEPVGSRPAGVSPFGIEDLAGNVREWLQDSPPDAPHRRLAVGGSWQEPSYSFEASHAVPFPPDFVSPSLGFRTTRPAPRR